VESYWLRIGLQAMEGSAAERPRGCWSAREVLEELAGKSPMGQDTMRQSRLHRLNGRLQPVAPDLMYRYAVDSSAFAAWVWFSRNLEHADDVPRSMCPG